MCWPRRPRFLRERRLLDDHQVPALGERRVRPERRVDLRAQLLAHLRIAIGGQLVVVGALEDRQPGRHAAEHLAVLHGEPVHHAAGIAERDGPDALSRRRLDVLEVLLPPPRLPRLLEQRVVHDRPTARLGDPAEQPVLQLGIRAAAALDHAGAGLAQDVGQREQLRFRRAGGGNALPLDVEVVHVAGDREPERARIDGLAQHAPHGLELGVRGRRAPSTPRPSRRGGRRSGRRACRR